MKQVRKVLLVNQFNSDNLGDKLLNDAFRIELNAHEIDVCNIGFAQLSPQSVVYKQNITTLSNILSYIKRSLPPVLKYWLNYKKRLNDIFKSLDRESYSAIIIGGGQLLKHHSVFMYCLASWVKYAQQSRIPIYLYGVGIDYGLSPAEISFYQKVLKSVVSINVRDNESKELFQQYFQRDVTVSPDIAFTYLPQGEHTDRTNLVVMPYHHQTARKAFGFNANRFDYYHDLHQQIIRITNHITPARIIITATTSSDAAECAFFADYLSKNHIYANVSEITTYDELSSLLFGTSHLLTGRMHAMILGLLCGCTVHPIRISNKIKNFEKEYLNCNLDLRHVASEARRGVQLLIKQIIQP